MKKLLTLFLALAWISTVSAYTNGITVSVNENGQIITALSPSNWWYTLQIPTQIVTRITPAWPLQAGSNPTNVTLSLADASPTNSGAFPTNLYDLLSTRIGTNDADLRYVQTELDPLFLGSPAYDLTAMDLTNLHTMYYLWGDHRGAGYLTNEPDFLASVAATLTVTDLVHVADAYAHSLITAGNPHGTTIPDIPGLSTALNRSNAVNNVIFFGAIRNGVTDSTAAFAAAFAAAATNGMPVYVPGGDFVCAPLVIPSGVQWVFGDGQSSRIIMPSGTNGWLWDANSITCSFWNLHFSGGGTNSYNGSGYSVGTRHGLRYWSMGHSALEALYFDGFNGVCLTVNGDTNIYTRQDYAYLGNVNCWNSYAGVEFKTGASEYLRAVNFCVTDCALGILTLSPNIEHSGHRISDCYTGAYFSASDARIHQNFANSSINHCAIAVRVVNGSTGLNLANVRVMGSGIISVENSTGVHIHGGLYEGLTLNIDAASGQTIFEGNVFAGAAANYINDASGKLIARDNYDSHNNLLAMPSGKGGYGLGPGDNFYLRGLAYQFPTNAPPALSLWVNHAGYLSNAIASVYPSTGRQINLNDANGFTYIYQLSLQNPVNHIAGQGIYSVPAKFGTGTDTFLYDATALEFLDWLGASTSASPNTLARRTSDGVVAAQAFDAQYSLPANTNPVSVTVKIPGTTIYHDASAGDIRGFLQWVTNCAWATNAGYATSAGSATTAASASTLNGYVQSTNVSPGTLALRDVNGVIAAQAFDAQYSLPANATPSSVTVKIPGTTVYHDASAGDLRAFLQWVTNCAWATNAGYATSAGTATTATTASSATYATSAGSAATATAASSANTSAIATNAYALNGATASISAAANTLVQRDSSGHGEFNHLKLANSAGDQSRAVYRIMGQFQASPQSSDMYVYPVTRQQIVDYAAITTNDIPGLNTRLNNLVTSDADKVNGSGTVGQIPMMSGTKTISAAPFTLQLASGSYNELYVGGQIRAATDVYANNIAATNTVSGASLEAPVLVLDCTNGYRYPVRVVIIGGTATLQLGAHY